MYVGGKEVSSSAGLPIALDTSALIKELVQRLGYEIISSPNGEYDLQEGQTTIAEAAKVIVDSKSENSVNVTVVGNEESLLQWMKKDTKSTI